MTKIQILGAGCPKCVELAANAERAATELGIRSIPTLIVFKDGKPAQEFVGVTQESALISAIDEAQ